MSSIFFERTKCARALLASLALSAAAASAPAHAGNIVSYTLPFTGSAPTGITAGPDGNLWFTEFEGNRIGRMTVDGVLLDEFKIPTALCVPMAITAGPDGNLWFTEYTGGKIGKITPAGVITEYAATNTGPSGIAVGPDGNLWFADIYGRIGKMSTAGVVLDEFPLPSGTVVYDITNGPDGNLWFAEATGNAIGKITPSGVITEYAVPTANSSPEYIASGADGNLWFTEYSSGKIGKITTAGVITEYPLPMSNSRPEGIASGADGNLWFVEAWTGNVGRITTGGVITEYPFPNPVFESPAAQIVAGPDGNMWFTYPGTDTISRVTMLPAPIVTMAFSPSSVLLSRTSNVSAPSVLTIALSNPNDFALTGVAFADVFPAGLYGTSIASTCGGTVTPTTGNFTSAKLSGASIPPNGSCTVSINVFATATGRIVDYTGAVTSGNALPSAGAGATLAVGQPPPPPVHCSPSGGCE